ncbi:MAG: hypothetical protein JWL83_3752 [Actinomycetia bacterium]|nr:hypothetical protein [Actinomycetes bacterium]
MPVTKGWGRNMVGNVRRRAALLALAVAYAVAAGGAPASAVTAVGDLTLHVGPKTAFKYTPPSSPTLTQKINSGDGCNRSFAESPDLMHVFASAPEGATLGRFQGKIGVCFQEVRPSARSGRVDGDRSEALTLQLGSDPSLAGKKVQSADLRVEGRGTLTVTEYLDNSLIGTTTLDSATATPQGPAPLDDNYIVTVDPGAVFNRLVLTAGPTSFYGLVGGRQGSGDSVFHLTTTSGTLQPGDTAPPVENGGVTATLTFVTGDHPINYDLTLFTSPDGTHNVVLSKDADPSERFTMTIDWGPEPFCDFSHGLCPHTQLDPDNGGPQPPADAQLCGPTEPNATVPWCISDQHYSIIQGNPQQVRLVETYSGFGDPRWSR